MSMGFRIDLQEMRVDHFHTSLSIYVIDYLTPISLKLLPSQTNSYFITPFLKSTTQNLPKMPTCCRNSGKPSPHYTLSAKPQPDHLTITLPNLDDDDPLHLWRTIRSEASLNSLQDPFLSTFYRLSILSHASLAAALAAQLAGKLSLPADALYSVFLSAFECDGGAGAPVAADLRAARDRDPACEGYLSCFLNYKGFLAVEAYRAAHWLWERGRVVMAAVVQSRAAEVFGVDVHPAARIGRGVLVDHGSGVLVGEGAVVGERVTVMHGVTVEGVVEDGVFVGAGACVLGGVRVGRGAKIGAGAVVVEDVPPAATAVGNPARVAGGKGVRKFGR